MAICLISFQALSVSAELFPTACIIGKKEEQMQSRYYVFTWCTSVNHLKYKNNTPWESTDEEGLLEHLFAYLKQYSYDYAASSLHTDLHKQAS